MTISVSKPSKAIEHLLENGPIVRYRIGNAPLSIRLKKGKTLTGNSKVFVEQVGDGSIIKLFDKTPFPEKASDVVCPHFYELKWANGCIFDCAWCYLNGTYRFLERGKKPYLKDKEKIEQTLLSFFKQWKEPSILNSGELADSLVFEGDNYSISKNIIPLFKKQLIHKLLILTKSDNVQGIIDSDSQDVVITSFSINSYDVAEKWEHAPHPRKRIEAAKRLFDAGYEVRIRLDPIVPIENWEESYIEVIDKIFSTFYPKRITIGSLRGLQSTINNCRDTSWIEYLENSIGSNWGKKIADETRLDTYETIIQHLEDQYHYTNIALCKETIYIWNKLKLNYKNIRCNCMP